ncbi:unnamed protein product [Arabidopsis halleri]
MVKSDLEVETADLGEYMAGVVNTDEQVVAKEATTTTAIDTRREKVGGARSVCEGEKFFFFFK